MRYTLRSSSLANVLTEICTKLFNISVNLKFCIFNIRVRWSKSITHRENPQVSSFKLGDAFVRQVVQILFLFDKQFKRSRILVLEGLAKCEQRRGRNYPNI